VTAAKAKLWSAAVRALLGLQLLLAPAGAFAADWLPAAILSSESGPGDEEPTGEPVTCSERTAEAHRPSPRRPQPAARCHTAFRSGTAPAACFLLRPAAVDPFRNGLGSPQRC
jgi:hypothetical protein